ncbi:MAG: hypothetical protein MZV64_72620 [Ignavibacteriales bacterium]|nr:hypothetical protein [Ignavibacteriales bacterium]
MRVRRWPRSRTGTAGRRWPLRAASSSDMPDAAQEAALLAAHGHDRRAEARDERHALVAHPVGHEHRAPDGRGPGRWPRTRCRCCRWSPPRSRRRA